MKQLSRERFADAERYLVRNARLIERRRFEHAFRGGDPEPVRSALHGYRNRDGAFALALEPDLRGATGQPQQIEIAFWILDEIGGFDDPAVRAACDWLEKHSTDEGGVPWVLPNVVDAERAPWWQPQGGPDGPAPASINPTAPLAGLLHAHDVDHPWLEAATAFCWDRIAGLSEVGAYDALCVLAFLERVGDRDRAEAEFDRLRDSLRGAAALDPDAPGHVHSPLDLAPSPDATARRLFTEEEIDRHLDALIDAQSDDGGWGPNFPMWTPVVTHEWGGFLTLARLRTLDAYGRLA
ncbi:hypothetical protein [Glycomyces xiaoerkulensis]|uniref:hypothetical protein n=1 Tax=Glycomyces xiaoerkulensis TaxID=2038139 RepID=UPI000C256554|nr:hypothetical protein [Glycomyces xiaoerkulensis]